MPLPSVTHWLVFSLGALPKLGGAVSQSFLLGGNCNGFCKFCQGLSHEFLLLFCTVLHKVSFFFCQDGCNGGITSNRIHREAKKLSLV